MPPRRWILCALVILLAGCARRTSARPKSVFAKKFIQVDPKIIAYENLVNKTKETILSAFQESERKGIQASMEMSAQVQRLTYEVFHREYAMIKETKAAKKELVETSHSYAVASHEVTDCVRGLQPDKALEELDSGLESCRKCMRKLKASCEALETELTKTIVNFRSYAMQSRSAVGKCQLSKDRAPDDGCLRTVAGESAEMMQVLPYRLIQVKHKAKNILDASGETLASCCSRFEKAKARVSSLLNQVRQCNN